MKVNKRKIIRKKLITKKKRKHHGYHGAPSLVRDM
jgi:hypothetical protein